MRWTWSGLSPSQMMSSRGPNCLISPVKAWIARLSSSDRAVKCSSLRTRGLSIFRTLLHEGRRDRRREFSLHFGALSYRGSAPAKPSPCGKAEPQARLLGLAVLIDDELVVEDVDEVAGHQPLPSKAGARRLSAAGASDG